MLALATALQTALPDAALIFVSEVCFDTVNFPNPSTLKSKGCLPFDFTLPASGLSISSYSTEMLEVAASPTVKNKLAILKDANTYCAGLPQWDGQFSNDYWKIMRLGCSLIDGLHPNFAGEQLIAHNMLAGLATMAAVTVVPKFKAMASNITSTYTGIFNALLVQSGDGWANQAPDPAVDKLAYEMTLTRKLSPQAWFYPYRTRFTVQGPSGANAPTLLVLENAPPSASIQYSLLGFPFVASGQSTSADGFGIIHLPPAYAGSPNLIKVGNEVYGPFTVTSLSTVEQTAEGNLVLGKNRPAQTTTVDFKSSGTGTYDVRLAASGGTGSGGGTLTVIGNVALNGTHTVGGTTTFNGNVVINTAGAVNCATLAASGGITTPSTVTATGNIASSNTVSAPTGTFTTLTANNFTAPTAAIGRITVDGVYIDTQTTGVGTWIDIAGVAGFIPGMGVAPPTDNAMALGASGYRWTSVWATSGVVSTSDATAKKNVKDEKLGLSFVESLRPVSYKWRASKDKGTYHGFIAQEVHESLAGRPFAGLTEPDGEGELYGLRYSEFIAPLTKAIQELAEQNRALSARISQLET